MKPILVTALLVAASAAQAGPVFFDMGTANSDLWEGFARVTDDSVYSAETGFGWQTSEGLKASARAYKELVENDAAAAAKSLRRSGPTRSPRTSSAAIARTRFS